MKIQLLVVDDESAIRDLLADYFTRRGYQIALATSSSEARRFMRESPPDLAILDIALGDGDGLDLLSEFKAALPATPVIMLTGLGYDEELLQTAIRNGASGFVSKTMSLDHLHLEVIQVLEQHKITPGSEPPETGTK